MRPRYISLIMPFVVLIAIISGTSVSCSSRGGTSKYIKELKEISAQYNKKCPIQNSNGTTLESVTFLDSIMLYRLSVPERALAAINSVSVKDSIRHNMSDKLKEYLVKGNCILEYRYITSSDSVSIIISPKELTDSISK